MTPTNPHHHMKKIRLFTTAIAASTMALLGFTSCRCQKKSDSRISNSKPETESDIKESGNPIVSVAVTDSDSIKSRHRRIREDLETVKPLYGVQIPRQREIQLDEHIKKQEKE